jgi:hypothetical protein
MQPCCCCNAPASLLVALPSPSHSLQGQILAGPVKSATVAIEVEGPVFAEGACASPPLRPHRHVAARGASRAGPAVSQPRASSRRARNVSPSHPLLPLPATDRAAVGDLVKAAVLKGLLPALPGSELDPESVNLLNGPLLAADADVKVRCRRETAW